MQLRATGKMFCCQHEFDKQCGDGRSWFSIFAGYRGQVVYMHQDTVLQFEEEKQ